MVLEVMTKFDFAQTKRGSPTTTMLTTSLWLGLLNFIILFTNIMAIYEYQFFIFLQKKSISTMCSAS